MKLKLEETTFNKLLFHSQEFEVEGITLLTGPSGCGKTTILKQLIKNYKCGYVSQDPDNQLVCDKVWHELAFGLENIGTPSSVIRNRVAEVATYLGLDVIINKDVSELSGGQKQRVCLAAVLCMMPDLILLDEPTSMLDPISSREFWEIVIRLSKEKGIKFLIVEHDTSYIRDFCNFHYLLKDGFLTEINPSFEERIISYSEKTFSSLISLSSLRKSYDSNLVINIPKLNLVKGINCFIGPNGSGKTTLLKLLTGCFKEKKLLKESVLMPQDIKILFSKDTVEKEFKAVNASIPDFFEPLKFNHPLDLSGGEQHLLAVYLTLARTAKVYCFDEPTKGLDYENKCEIMQLIKESGKDCIVVSHDLDLVAEFATKVFFLFNREIASEGHPYDVFKDNIFYRPERILWDPVTT